VRRDEGEGEEEEDIGGCGGRGREGRRRMRECAAQRRREKGLVVDQEGPAACFPTLFTPSCPQNYFSTSLPSNSSCHGLGQMPHGHARVPG